MAEKRKRSPNWLDSEKILLLDLVEKHFNIIESKKTDGVSLKTKLAEWQVIADEYNSQTTHCHREPENLKAQWESMKKAAKKDASNARMHMIKTGGGPPDMKKEDPIYSRITPLIKTTVLGLHNLYDNDSVVPLLEMKNHHHVRKVGICCTIVYSVPLYLTKQIALPLPLQPENENKNITKDLVEGVTSVEFEVKDWSDYTPQLLRTPVSAPLKNQIINKSWITKRRPAYTATSSSLEQLHKKKIEAIDYQKELALKENDHANSLAEIDLKIKEEILKQEKFKTRLLMLDLRIKKKELQKYQN